MLFLAFSSILLSISCWFYSMENFCKTYTNIPTVDQHPHKINMSQFSMALVHFLCMSVQECNRECNR